MSALGDAIALMVAHDGPITLENYISLCLTHPKHGYYMTRDPFGRGGDFITAPEISQIFGELLGLWMTEAWRASGQPAPARLVELGPGRGTLMSDVLRVGRVAPPFLDEVSVHLVETSPVLRETQQRTLQGAIPPLSWSADFDAVPPGPAFILANEFFDALPVRHYMKSASGWRERLVGVDSRGALSFGLSGYVERSLNVDAPDGSIIEVGALGQRLMGQMARRIVAEGGAMLVVDYGYTQTTLGESLQAIKNHAYVDPLDEPGEADLTTHVDFAALRRAAEAEGAKVQGPVMQGAFLRELGMDRRAEVLSRSATPEQRADIAAAVERLGGAGPKAMGDLFKVIAVLHPDMPDMPGFSEA